MNIILCGDLNINYLGDMSSNRLKLDSLLASYHLDNSVDFPIRVTCTSATAIDNFFINKSIDKNFLITSMTNELSDHDAQILILNNFLFPNLLNYPITRRVINECTIMEFDIRHSHESWDDVFNIRDDVNLMFSNFLNTYIRVFNHSFPYKMYFPNQKKKQPWITTGIKVSCAHKRELYRLSRQTQNLEIIGYYKKYCKVLTEVIKVAKNHSIIT
jgi:hypothetical protein